MKRIATPTRIDYIKKLEEISFEFHTLDGAYWNEAAHYSFSMEEVNTIERATNELYAMCLKAVAFIIENKYYATLRIDEKLIPLIERSWCNNEPSIYGRFDLAYNGIDQPKMLEFNADTPTTLYECAVVQWKWLEEINPKADQFNSVHEKLIACWASCKKYFNKEIVHFCSVDTIEDFTTTEYLRDTAQQAGLNTKYLNIQDIGWDENNRVFVDLEEKEIKNIFKLYPWEWMIDEQFGFNIGADKNKTRWIEPAWKSILSNKAILAVLWQLFPYNEYLLPCYFGNEHELRNFVVKPIYSREGANVSIFKDGILETETSGEYGEEGFVYQKLYDLEKFDDYYPIIGSWIIGDEAAGMGIRESKTKITGNLSLFVPHLIEKTV